ncbi:menD: 2-succinyl-5-enolpyruvyl-6-hydroxy-3-cyclohexene-1-carboxylic-acid synthase [Rubrobacter radiotolerans]|uniref:2-succinyl-5-enolpyruvyl-6-hydroxy-3-cyclohexene-1-carboxylate synthase n=1 Tax=Rubrobacter radiotolerans TaxID=42256 RepID=A0A023X5L2_RUBRA|nr:2-succinyl-5-enolpyruvyl-6-hydroxy-3-cyclohexene-1-carboxylic-acid synthase [Rubrobacter radiotolerans]AHY47598.1 menD: 2-succinyl-5-enolpyruvyl-6-hydroxy-3-cyclohexene-1-carboxylic-acid synthase [Rubrobacter radiotolerans]MDX5895003.1 2-succinyl-5-enolpyruvyl-6-hydroxy-3-cyclohexene-1-carboxylic-acid synthase [Rubrobacter radiotolerans]SMC07254.1 2-succinyl-5-enolpyruvyl-6-hydroxy-3-cyclohexene-1-carboxylate synthase [Rubrobacter radiotolerans DSM 5868]
MGTGSAGRDTARANLLLATLLVEECLRGGVTDFFLAPGSRSTPLVAALAANDRANVHVHYDERGTAFAALGYARATGRPAGWVTTSGTAVANGLPAVVEAATDGVPMLLLTADRPPELRRTGANQTVDQPGIFGGYVRWDFDLPAPGADTDPASLLTTVDQALHRARRLPAGPVHLNLMFREPLLPEPDGMDLDLPASLARWMGTDRPYTLYPPPETTSPREALRDLAAELRGAERGLVVAGRLASAAGGRAAGRLAERLGWPLLADVGSQARFGEVSKNLVPYYDLALLDRDFTERNRPDVVVHLGGGSVSKRLGNFVAESRPEVYAVARPDPARLDPAHIVTHHFESGVGAFCEALAGYLPEPGATGGEWLDRWREASRRVGSAVRAAEIRAFEAGEMPEPVALALAVRELPPGGDLVVASSLPVRDVDSYAAPETAGRARVCANRGASGIDGTLATAAGFARGTGGPVTVLIGDLALLHDLNSLAMLRGLPVAVVVVNNDGGGIFSMLPISRHESFFERYFGTPHGLGFREVAATFGLEYGAPENLREFRDLYRRSVGRKEPTLIELKTDREAGARFRREFRERLGPGEEGRKEQGEHPE